MITLFRAVIVFLNVPSTVTIYEKLYARRSIVIRLLDADKAVERKKIYITLYFCMTNLDLSLAVLAVQSNHNKNISQFTWSHSFCFSELSNTRVDFFNVGLVDSTSFDKLIFRVRSVFGSSIVYSTYVSTPFSFWGAKLDGLSLVVPSNGSTMRFLKSSCIVAQHVARHQKMDGKVRYVRNQLKSCQLTCLYQ